MENFEILQQKAKELLDIARKMRRDEMQRLKDYGWTLEEIGDKFGGISKERVRQILEGKD